MGNEGAKGATYETIRFRRLRFVSAHGGTPKYQKRAGCIKKGQWNGGALSTAVADNSYWVEFIGQQIFVDNDREVGHKVAPARHQRKPMGQGE
jgi:hypothetical protein